MTSGRRFGITCHSCNGQVRLCPYCNERLYPDTNFSRWIRQLRSPNNGANASCHNLDYVWFRFYDNWLITVEEKTNGKRYNLNIKADASQIQSHQLIRQMISFASGNKFDISFGRSKRYEPVYYKGHFVISFQNSYPEDSEWCLINDIKYYNSAIVIDCLYWSGILLEPNIDLMLPSPVLVKQTGLTHQQVGLLKSRSKQ